MTYFLWNSSDLGPIKSDRFQLFSSIQVWKLRHSPSFRNVEFLQVRQVDESIWVNSSDWIHFQLNQFQIWTILEETLRNIFNLIFTNIEILQTFQIRDTLKKMNFNEFYVSDYDLKICLCNFFSKLRLLFINLLNQRELKQKQMEPMKAQNW